MWDREFMAHKHTQTQKNATRYGVYRQTLCLIVYNLTLSETFSLHMRAHQSSDAKWENILKASDVHKIKKQQKFSSIKESGIEKFENFFLPMLSIVFAVAALFVVCIFACLNKEPRRNNFCICKCTFYFHLSVCCLSLSHTPTTSTICVSAIAREEFIIYAN